MTMPDLDPIIDGILGHDEAAWQLFWQVVEPKLYAMIRRPNFLGRLSQSEDHCRNIVVEVLAALRADDCARLRHYSEARRESPKLPFLAWLAVVAKRLAIDYMRRQGEYRDRRDEEDASAKGGWHEIDPLPADSELPGAPTQATDRQTARELLEYATTALESDQLALLEGWIRGESFDELARAHTLPDGRAAQRKVRAAIERLRRHFRTGGGAP